jgi:hypothetical protein
MRIVIEPADYRCGDCQWQAWEPDRYDGAPDGYNHIGTGPTPLEALDDYLWRLDLDEVPPCSVEIKDDTGRTRRVPDSAALGSERADPDAPDRAEDHE